MCCATPVSLQIPSPTRQPSTSIATGPGPGVKRDSSSPPRNDLRAVKWRERSAPSLRAPSSPRCAAPALEGPCRDPDSCVGTATPAGRSSVIAYASNKLFASANDRSRWRVGGGGTGNLPHRKVSRTTPHAHDLLLAETDHRLLHVAKQDALVEATYRTAARRRHRKPGRAHRLLDVAIDRLRTVS